MCKCTVLLLVACLVVSSFSVLAVSSVSAQSGFKPSVPQFSVKLVDSSYDVPPSTSTTVDQYTGKETTTTTQGYRVEQRSIEVTIKNQPFTPYTNADRKEINLYYTVHVKGSFGEDWTIFGHVQDFGSYTAVSSSPYTVQSDSEYTVLTSVIRYAAGSQLDFKVQAVVGYLYNDNAGRLIPPWYLVAIETSSGWSSIQVFIVPDGPSTSSAPTQTVTLPPPTTSDDNSSPPQSPEYVIFSHPFFLLGVGALFGGVVVAVVMLILKKQFKTSTSGGEGLYA